MEVAETSPVTAVRVVAVELPALKGAMARAEPVEEQERPRRRQDFRGGAAAPGRPLEEVVGAEGESTVAVAELQALTVPAEVAGAPV